MKEVDRIINENTMRFLETDAICKQCGAVINGYYETSCIVCSCGGDNFVSGRVCIDIRILLNVRLYELKVISLINRLPLGSRSRMTYQIIKKRYSNNINFDESLIKNMIRSNKKSYWYIKNIKNALDRRNSK